MTVSFPLIVTRGGANLQVSDAGDLEVGDRYPDDGVEYLVTAVGETADNPPGWTARVPAMFEIRTLRMGAPDCGPLRTFLDQHYNNRWSGELTIQVGGNWWCEVLFNDPTEATLANVAWRSSLSS